MNSGFANAGMRIADRFELTTKAVRSYSHRDTSTWLAVDTVLSRQLRAIVINPESIRRDAAIDAARKASLLKDPHTVSILSVVDDSVHSAIFTELPLGTPVSHFLIGKPLPANLAMAIIGQVASTLNEARHRGIRYLHLQARNIYVTETNQVLIDGLGVLPALYEVDLHRESAELDRSETRGLAVFFAALLQGQDFPEDAAQHDAVIAAARDLPDLPAQVRELFESELGNTELSAPDSPAEFMRRIAPWDLQALSHLFTEEFLAEVASVHAKKKLGAEGAAEAGTEENLVEFTADDANETELFAAISDPIDELSATQQLSALDIKVADEPLLTGKPHWPSPFADSEVSISDLLATEDAEDASPRELSADATFNETNETEAEASTGSHGVNNDSNETEFEAIESFTAAKTLPDSSTADTLTTPAVSASVQKRRKETASAELTSTNLVSEPSSTDDDHPVADTQTRTIAESAGAGSLTGETRYNPTKVVVICFSILMLIGLIIGIMNLLKPLAPVELPQNPDTNTSAQENNTSAPSPTIEEEVVPTIDSVEFVNASGDIDINNPDFKVLVDQAKFIADGDTSTAWYSWWYRQQAGYQADRNGLRVKLKEPAVISEITVSSESQGGQFEIRNTSGEVSAESAPSLAAASFEAGENQVIKIENPVEVSEFTIWIEEMPQTGNQIQAKIVEINVK